MHELCYILSQYGATSFKYMQYSWYLFVCQKDLSNQENLQSDKLSQVFLKSLDRKIKSKLNVKVSSNQVFIRPDVAGAVVQTPL